MTKSSENSRSKELLKAALQNLQDPSSTFLTSLSFDKKQLWVVYNASARAYSDAPSLNECLYPRPALQNKLWDVLVWQRFYPVAIFGDIQKAFL